MPRISELIIELADVRAVRRPGQRDARGSAVRAIRAPSRRLFGHVAVAGDEVIGFALWFLNYSTWFGKHGIYLEDLYVTPGMRGRGAGKALLAELASICVRRGYGRLEWWVLDWNSPAIGFYESLGAVAMTEWTMHRLTGPQLADLAKPPSRR